MCVCVCVCVLCVRVLCGSRGGVVWGEGEADVDLCSVASPYPVCVLCLGCVSCVGLALDVCERATSGSVCAC